MARKKTKKKAATKKTVRRPKAKLKTKAKATIRAKSKARASKRGAERRKFRRYAAKNLWVTELTGDYRFVAAAANISEGGIFLKGRMKMSASSPSTIRIPLPSKDGASEGSLELSAQAIYDRVAGEAYGTAFKFVEMNSMQAKALRGLLRNLN